jgi:hypothetical protein
MTESLTARLNDNVTVRADYDERLGLLTITQEEIPIVIVAPSSDYQYLPVVTVAPSQAGVTMPYARWKCQGYYGIDATSEFVAVVDFVPGARLAEEQCRELELEDLWDQVSDLDPLEFWVGGTSYYGKLEPITPGYPARRPAWAEYYQ